MNNLSFTKKSLSILSCLIFLNLGCEDVASVSILEDTDSFIQETSFNNKIDVLWVIDNSGSMANLQANVASNFEAFINQFELKNYDFQIAVTTTEAWRESNGNIYCAQSNNISRFRDDSGFSILTADTPDLSNAFLTNISQGTSGCGDERAFESMKLSLENEDNIAMGFPRADAFLAVIIVSDEDDFSHDGGEFLGQNYSDPALIDPLVYVNFLDQLTNSNPIQKTYNVSSISILDEACRLENTPYGLISHRYSALVDQADGVKASVCAPDFSENLELIQSKIISLSTQFFLTRLPHPESIEVIVDGSVMAESEINGWSYNELSNSILFYGDSVPSQGAVIEINFDPITLQN
ncbi:MAG: hypothetical protein AB8E15_03125 [Bdellovibrionales bacterium]